jgi:phospholipase C
MLRLRLGLLLIPIIYLAPILTGCGGGGSGSQQGTPDFTLSAAPSGLTIAQGGQESGTINITPQSGFNGSVNLSASGLPNGVTAAFNPSLATTASTLALSIAANSPTGTTTVTITGTSGTLTKTTTLSLTIIAQGAIPIQHVVIIVQENRTPDNLFHDPVLIGHGADIASQGKTSTGQTVTLTPVSLVTNYDLSHTHDAFLDACDYNSSTNSCAMDGADLIVCNPIQNCPSVPEYQYVQQSDVQPYFTMAETYTFADRMFQTNEGPSFPAHQYLLSGTSAIEATSTTSVADNPANDDRADGNEWAGCLAPPGAYVNAIDTSDPNPTSPTFVITNQLCFEHPTLTDLLDTANLSWKYYTALPGSIWTAPDAIQHMCVPSPAYPSEKSVCTGSDWTDHVVIEGSGAQILTDIAAGQLSAVSWVIPTGANSDHAGSNDGGGPSWVASIVNAVGESPYWQNAAIIVLWDDWGGWYDHQPPSSIRDSYEYGLRVPLLVISPYAKPAYVSHVNHDFGSVLKFVEVAFDLGEVDPAVGYADSRSDDLSDCFDFTQTPLTFTPIQSSMDADHFLHDKRAATPPDDD